MMAGAGVAGFAGAAGWVADGSGVDPGVRLVLGEGAPGGWGGGGATVQWRHCHRLLHSTSAWLVWFWCLRATDFLDKVVV